MAAPRGYRKVRPEQLQRAFEDELEATTQLPRLVKGDLEKIHGFRSQRLVLAFTACRKPGLLWQAGVLLALRDLGLLRECGALVGVGMGNLVVGFLLSALRHVERKFLHDGQDDPVHHQQWLWERLISRPEHGQDLLWQLVVEPLMSFALLDHEKIRGWQRFMQCNCTCLDPVGYLMSQDLVDNPDRLPLRYPESTTPVNQSVKGRMPALVIGARRHLTQQNKHHTHGMLLALTQDVSIRTNDASQPVFLMKRAPIGTKLAQVIAAVITEQPEDTPSVNWGHHDPERGDQAQLDLISASTLDPLGIHLATEVQAYYRLGQEITIQEKKKEKKKPQEEEEKKEDEEEAPQEEKKKKEKPRGRLLLVDAFTDSMPHPERTRNMLIQSHRSLDAPPDPEGMELRSRFCGVPLRLFSGMTTGNDVPAGLRANVNHQRQHGTPLGPVDTSREAEVWWKLGYAQCMRTWGLAAEKDVRTLHRQNVPRWEVLIQTVFHFHA